MEFYQIKMADLPDVTQNRRLQQDEKRSYNATPVE